MGIMDNEVFHFEDDDDDYQTSNDEYSDENENEPWETRSRRSTNPEEQTCREIPADQFLSKINVLTEPTVKIVVNSMNGSKQTLMLPKSLLCTRSPFFHLAFNAPLRESASQSQELHLPETSIAEFELVIQFLSTDAFTFPHTVIDSQEKLTLYLLFFQSCHRFSITGLSPIIIRFRNFLRWCSARGEFPDSFHMQLAISLPPSHEARKLAVAACVKPYACSITKSSTCYGRALFHLEKYVEEETQFAADLFRAYTKAVRGALGTHTIVDPLTGTDYTVSTGVACQLERSRGDRCVNHLGKF
ncbi:uncharacterized protein EAE98_009375 [Botrytis deweyae]|uniref:BTB domain-containing protein n=1 Tax=Botrytis deweyae TaxID=2478750 RepID=A0ABQ7IC37_9HELO|nr:uncharacterized protein EAE98_009375 [Botrytis deweyae]KAF7919535.1 hypothetical protein EAE98_009375 [Botrytis deweyae]